MSACDTESEMYSKCMVEPLMSTPMAIMASKGAVDAPADFFEDASVSLRSAVLEERRSVAEDRMFELAEVDCATEVVHIFCTA